MSDLHREVKNEVAKLREEMRSEVAKLREEMRSEVASLRLDNLARLDHRMQEVEQRTFDLSLRLSTALGPRRRVPSPSTTGAADRA